MSVVTISKGSFSRGEQVALAVAERLGYECVAREDLLKETSDEYNIPEIQLQRALYDAHSFWERISQGQTEFIAHIRVALLKRLRKDNLVYHGLAGQYFVRNVPHVLKVRVVADRDDRARVVMDKDGVDEKEARQVVKRTDAERRKWSEHLYGIEIMDPTLYDLVVHVKHLSVENAAELICQTVAFDRFQTTAESKAALGDLLIAAEVKMAILDLKPEAVVRCTRGHVTIAVREKVVRVNKTAARLENRAVKVSGVGSVKVDTEVKA